jgi:SAM-dependent methyltransferase
MTKSDWDYRGLAAECYDLWFGNEPFWDQAFFHERIRQNGGMALEVACGTGRLLVPFVRDGLAVEGVDASEEMLALCRIKAAHAGVTPTLLELPRFGGGRRGGRVGFGRGGAGAVLRRNQPSRFWRDPRPLIDYLAFLIHAPIRPSRIPATTTATAKPTRASPNRSRSFME